MSKSVGGDNVGIQTIIEPENRATFTAKIRTRQQLGGEKSEQSQEVEKNTKL